jgi:hypothetical protein
MKTHRFYPYGSYPYIKIFLSYCGIIEMPKDCFIKENCCVYLSPNDTNALNGLCVYRYFSQNMGMTNYFVYVNDVLYPIFGLFEANSCRIYIAMGTYIQREVFLPSYPLQIPQQINYNGMMEEEQVVFNNWLFNEINQINLNDPSLDMYSTNESVIPTYTPSKIWN